MMVAERRASSTCRMRSSAVLAMLLVHSRRTCRSESQRIVLSFCPRWLGGSEKRLVGCMVLFL